MDDRRGEGDLSAGDRKGARRVKFYLGTDMKQWLVDAHVPLFLSYRVFGKQASHTLPRASAPWALDSGGFAELIDFGKWTVSAEDYVAGTRRLRDAIGNLEFACPQDWVCSPPALAATGKTIEYHQRASVESVIELRELAPEIHWTPVLQGWSPVDYHGHWGMYEGASINLVKEPLVCVGSIALRQTDPAVGQVIRSLAKAGMKIHALGVKSSGLKMFGDVLASADSAAWFWNAVMRPGPMLAECKEAHRRGEHLKKCNHCLHYALVWRESLLSQAHELATKHAGEPLFEAEAPAIEDLATPDSRGPRARADKQALAARMEFDFTEHPELRRAEEISEGVAEEVLAHWDEQEEGQASMFPEEAA